MSGYDIELLRNITSVVNIPVIACGGAGNMSHLRDVAKYAQVSAVAAGSMFIFYGQYKAVLINYPEQDMLEKYLG